MNFDDTKLEQIYKTKELDYHKKRIDNLVQVYKNEFGNSDDIQGFSVSGRIEVGGNHTDHQLGKVLCASINIDTLAMASKTNDNNIRIISEGYDEIVIDAEDTKYRQDEENTTHSIIRGVCNRLKEKGHTIGGFNAVVVSDVLRGSGMSSSASFEGLIGIIINNFYCDNKETNLEIAKIGQYAENVYFGKPSGLMDQIGCVLGGFAYINFYDKENPVIEKIDSSKLAENYSICIIDTGDQHDDLTDEYTAITKDMAKVSDYFNEIHLSRVDEEKFYENLADVRRNVGDRPILRAMHFFKDNKTVELQKEALKKGDIDEFLRLVNISGRSSILNLQNIFSTREHDVQGSSIVLSLCENFLDGQGACRIHGGGFGGTVQAFVPTKMTSSFKENIEKVVGKDKCYVLSIRNIEGTRI